MINHNTDNEFSSEWFKNYREMAEAVEDDAAVRLLDYIAGLQERISKLEAALRAITELYKAGRGHPRSARIAQEVLAEKE